MPVSTERAVVARLESHGKRFEILVDPDRAYDVKKGKDVSLDELVVRQEVFEDVKKGTRIAESDIKSVFGTTAFKDIAYAIIRKGEVQLTTEQRRKMREAKIKEVVTLIARRAADPKTGLPHPPQRIENAIEQARVTISEFEPAGAQVERVVNAIRPILPISIEEVQIAVKIPAQHAAKAYGRIRDYGHMRKDEWMNDGSWAGVIEIPAGMQGDFFALLNNLTHGQVETKIMKK